MIIGIGGVSRAGKTTLANLLKKRLKGKTISILNQDEFVKKAGLPEINNHIDWEHPDSMDWISLRKKIKAESRKNEITIVEGLFAFYDEKIAAMYDLPIFMAIEKDIFLVRKRKDKRWGKEPDWFIHHIWNSYLKYGKLPAFIPEVLVINGTQKADIGQIVSAFILNKLVIH